MVQHFRIFFQFCDVFIARTYIMVQIMLCKILVGKWFSQGGSMEPTGVKVPWSLKGVLHPRLVFGLFLHFSQKLQHIGNK